MNDEQFDQFINTFLKNFNEMCATEKKDFLLRERVVNYESGSSIKTYNVTYRVIRKKNIWIVEAVSSGFWIFKRKFLLLKITRKKEKVNFAGLYTSSIIDFNEKLIDEMLKKYLNLCKKIPRDVFVKS